MEKKISDSKIEQVSQVRPEHLNGAGKTFRRTADGMDR